MKNIILVLLAVMSFSCALDEQMQEERYIDSHSWYASASDNYYKTKYIYIAISPDGTEYVDVTIDKNGNVYDSNGDWVFSY